MELERKQASQKASYAWRKERMLNDAEYHEQVLQSQKSKRDQKWKAIEENLLHSNPRNDVNRMAKVRRVVRDAQEALDAKERDDMIEKVHQRYFSYDFLYLICYRISELDAQFADL